tara:strand:- start:20 stop:802 length:783 start_codon:yes stop_codon:yes gene_type:complete
LERPTEPKIVNLTANSFLSEFFYIPTSTTAFSILLSTQKADTQYFDCYTFTNLTIGSCIDASINLSNSKEKYNKMNGSIFLLDGKNTSIEFSFYKALNFKLVDEVKLFINGTKNEFDWLSPVEEITSGFLYNLTYQGDKLGNIIENILLNMPQRDDWNTYIFGIDLKKDIFLKNNLIFFNEFSFLTIKQSNYRNISNIPDNNMSLTSGLELSYKDLIVKLFGKIYENNLYGFEQIAFNQRSEHHFDNNYGSIGISIRYNF